MFISDSPEEISWITTNKKKYTLNVTNNDTRIDIEKLLEEAYKVVENNQEECKKIAQLGYGTTGSSQGFLLGWILRSFKENKEWNINFTEETISDSEYKEHVAKLCRKGAEYMTEYAEKIETNDVSSPIKNMPIVGGNNGFDFS